MDTLCQEPSLERLIDGSNIKIGYVGIADYLSTWRAMKDFTASRTENTPDEIWLLQHPPVYTQGIAGRPEHLLRNDGIIVIRTDRGGQITYHGPGQIIAYLLLDMRRLKLGVRELIRKMEGAVIDLLRDYRIDAEGRVEAPGVYVEGAKIAALGLKIKNGCCYHGLALNVDMDLSPFDAINPCGYSGLRVTQTRDLGVADGLGTLSSKLADKLQMRLIHRPPSVIPAKAGIQTLNGTGRDPGRVNSGNQKPLDSRFRGNNRVKGK